MSRALMITVIAASIVIIIAGLLIMNALKTSDLVKVMALRTGQMIDESELNDNTALEDWKADLDEQIKRMVNNDRKEETGSAKADEN